MRGHGHRVGHFEVAERVARLDALVSRLHHDQNRAAQQDLAGRGRSHGCLSEGLLGRLALLEVDALLDGGQVWNGASARTVGRPQDRQLGLGDRSLVVLAPAHRGVAAVEVVAVHVWVAVVIHPVATSSLGVLRAAVARRGGVNRTGSGDSAIDTMPVLVQLYVVVVPPEVYAPTALKGK